MDAARVSGLSALQTMASHILPSLVGLMLIQMALFAGIALAVQTGLGFLGLATPAPAPSWGGMVGEAAQVIQQYPWFLYITGGVIAMMSIAFGLVGDGLRDASAARRGQRGQAAPWRERMPGRSRHDVFAMRCCACATTASRSAPRTA